MARRKFIAGNWKMYKTTAEATVFAQMFRMLLDEKPIPEADLAVCAPFMQLSALEEAFRGSPVGVGAQNMHFAEEGAYTGEISAPMLKEIGVDLCIIGHSERRQYFAETDETVNRKLKAAFAAKIVPIFCLGETLDERDAGQAFAVVERQLRAGLSGIPEANAVETVIAYEPVWAIGTGRTATSEQAQEMCAFIRRTLASLYGAEASDAVCIQYGGSVKPENAEELLAQPDIDGALVGGASLVPEQFHAICNAI